MLVILILEICLFSFLILSTATTAPRKIGIKSKKKKKSEGASFNFWGHECFDSHVLFSSLFSINIEVVGYPCTMSKPNIYKYLIYIIH